MSAHAFRWRRRCCTSRRCSSSTSRPSAWTRLREELWRTFHGIARSGVTLLISSHSMEEAEQSDALALLREGELLAADSPHGLRVRTGEHDLGRALVRLVTGRETAAA